MTRPFDATGEFTHCFAFLSPLLRPGAVAPNSLSNSVGLARRIRSSASSIILELLHTLPYRHGNVEAFCAASPRRGQRHCSSVVLLISGQTRPRLETRPRFSSSRTPNVEYEYIEDVERLAYYRPGGYHPVTIGDRLGNRYRVIHTLGFGSYSMTWLARDEERKGIVAVKVGTAESTTRELEILSALASTKGDSETAGCGRSHLPRLLDHFKVEGPNGVHPRYSLSDDQIYDRYGGPELEPVRRLEGGALPLGVPSHGVQSVWLGKASEDVRLSEAAMLLVDVGAAFSRAHESRSLSFPADIWTMACSIWTILAQRPLFEDILATPDNTTCEQLDVLGDLPPEWWNKWEARRQWFNEDGSPIQDRFLRSWETRFEDSVQKPRQRGRMPSIEAEERDAIVAMLRPMLSFRPETRLTAGQVLRSNWMEKWTLPAYEKMLAYSSRQRTE
ncbi:hypothetical protein ACCO45_006183 [Purpureocillium lilacinum]|uniref:Uncharacterized protein n=1 Tax=Purpureocillium lilacinum TaxID=33203 RepID=A0ACC4DXG8_PURLI